MNIVHSRIKNQIVSNGVNAGLSTDYGGTLQSVLDVPPCPMSSKSVLRYPGGKTRAVRAIRQYIPADTNILCSPFLGGASVELSCAADGITVHGSDGFDPLVVFWQEALKNPALLVGQVRRYYPMTRTTFYSLQQNYQTLQSPIERAAVFYVLNRCSFSGTTLSGGMSPACPRFTESAISKLRDFHNSNLKVQKADYKDALDSHKDTFLYLDPPYANGGKLYGNKGDMHDGFDHKELASQLHKRDGWVLSYNDCKEVRELYKKYPIHTPEWTYGMSGKKASKEVLICAT